MYLYRKPKTQRSRAVANEHMYQEIAHLNEAVKALTETVKERLRNL